MLRENYETSLAKRGELRQYAPSIQSTESRVYQFVLHYYIHATLWQQLCYNQNTTFG